MGTIQILTKNIRYLLYIQNYILIHKRKDITIFPLKEKWLGWEGTDAISNWD